MELVDINKMKKNYINYIINALLFIDVSSIAVIGFLLAFVIPRGRAARTSNFFLGMHRHDWGEVHLFLSVLLLILLAFHISFNWAWIVQSTKRYFGIKWKKVLWGFTVAWLLVLLIAMIVKNL